MRTRYDANGIYRGEDPVAALGAVGRVARNGMPTDYDPIWDAEHLYNSPRLSGNLAGTTNIVSSVELDPWGADTNRSGSSPFQPKTFTSYERDSNGSDEAMFRRYNRKHSRFDQPDPYDGSYSLTDPQLFTITLRHSRVPR